MAETLRLMSVRWKQAFCTKVCYFIYV